MKHVIFGIDCGHLRYGPFNAWCVLQVALKSRASLATQNFMLSGLLLRGLKIGCVVLGLSVPSGICHLSVELFPKLQVQDLVLFQLLHQQWQLLSNLAVVEEMQVPAPALRRRLEAREGHKSAHRIPRYKCHCSLCGGTGIVFVCPALTS